MLAGENLNDMLAKVLPVMNFLQNYLLLIFFFLLDMLVWESKWYMESILVFNIESSDTIC